MHYTGRQWLVIAERYMAHCYFRRTVPRVGELAALLRRSREWTTRSFTRAVGRAPAAVFRDLQIEHARHLLATTNRSIADIAKASAFGSTRAFYRTFLHCTGLGPSTYRRNTRDARSEAGDAQ